VSSHGLLNDVVPRNAQIIYNASTSILPEGSFVGSRGSDAVYVGAISTWIDTCWLGTFAKALRRFGASLNIIGAVEDPAIFELLRYENVYFHGEMPHDKAMKIASKCGIGVIPFRNSKLTEGIDPIKAYEYLSLGLKVVSAGTYGTNPEVAQHPLFFIQESLTNRFVRGLRWGSNSLDSCWTQTWESRVRSFEEQIYG
jgi:glycosyltransferase involved in cell wall biosynthesis